MWLYMAFAGKEPLPEPKVVKSLHPISYMSPYKTIKSYNEAHSIGQSMGQSMGLSNFDFIS